GDAGGRTSRLSPGAAFAAGIFPGGGQFYTGRPVFGVVVTVATAGVVAGGVFYERTTIRCRDASAGRDCPEELIAGRDTDRPYLGPALGAAAGVALIAAVEAALHAGRDRRRSAERTTGAVRLGLDGRVAFDGQDVHV